MKMFARLGVVLGALLFGANGFAAPQGGMGHAATNTAPSAKAAGLVRPVAKVLFIPTRLEDLFVGMEEVVVPATAPVGVNAPAVPRGVIIHPTDYALLNPTAVALVNPTAYPLIPTTHGSLIHQTDAVFLPTTAPLVNPLTVPLVPSGTSDSQ